MIRLQDLIIDPRSIGQKFWLVNVVPAYEYRNGVRSENIAGYKYETCLPDAHLEKISVRIDGTQMMQAPEQGYCEVIYSGLELRIV